MPGPPFEFGDTFPASRVTIYRDRRIEADHWRQALACPRCQWPTLHRVSLQDGDRSHVYELCLNCSHRREFWE